MALTLLCILLQVCESFKNAKQLLSAMKAPQTFAEIKLNQMH